MDRNMTGPYEMLAGKFPLYILQFNKHGENTSPQTTVQVLEEVRRGDYSHIYLISHGWNNTFGDALGLYRDFFNLFLKLRSEYVPDSDKAYRALFIGLHWPSIILLLPWEKGPRIAAGAEGDAAFESLTRANDMIAEELEPAARPRYYELSGKDRLSEAEARELAAILRPIYRANALDTEGDKPVEVNDDGIVAAWMSMPDREVTETAPDYSAHGRAHRNDQKIRAASAADLLDPRNAVRVTTVLLMKDRSGEIGRFGLTPFLKELFRAAGEVPIRLIGHSYGARVCLTALSSPELGSLRAASLLLLQPAVNQYCFAASVPGLGLGVPGGFVPALRRVGWPVLSTFSSNDGPLHTFFHLAARRIEDRGEIRFAAAGPSEFSALGGYGPDGIVPANASREEPIHAAGRPYVFEKGLEVLALNGSAGEIKGHGDVRTEYTCWALLSQEVANVL
jgi:pimeloyl-ACP methyl ester carboxylesterase